MDELATIIMKQKEEEWDMLVDLFEGKSKVNMDYMYEDD